METKGNTDFRKTIVLEFFKKPIENYSESLFIYSSLQHQYWEKTLFWLFLWSLPVCCLSVMFNAESEMFRNVHHWISYDQRCQNWSRLVQLWTSLKTQKSLNQRWKWQNICESSTRVDFSNRLSSSFWWVRSTYPVLKGNATTTWILINQVGWINSVRTML